MVIVDSQGFFKVLDRCFVYFFSLLRHAEVEKRVCFWWTLSNIFDLDLYSLFDGRNSDGILPQFQMNLAFQQVSLCIVAFFVENTLDQVQCMSELFFLRTFLVQHARQLNQNFSIVRYALRGMLQLFDTPWNISFAPDEGPSESKIDITDHIVVQGVSRTDLRCDLKFLTCVVELAFFVENLAAQQMQQVLITVLDLLFDFLQPLQTLVQVVHLIVVLSKTDMDLLPEKRFVCLHHLQQ